MENDMIPALIIISLGFIVIIYLIYVDYRISQTRINKKKLLVDYTKYLKETVMKPYDVTFIIKMKHLLTNLWLNDTENLTLEQYFEKNREYLIHLFTQSMQDVVECERYIEKNRQKEYEKTTK